MSRTVTTSCPLCEDGHGITGEVTYDPGVWRTANGDGWSATWEVECDPAQCPASGEFEDAAERMEDALIAEYRQDLSGYRAAYRSVDDDGSGAADA